MKPLGIYVPDTDYVVIGSTKDKFISKGELGIHNGLSGTCQDGLTGETGRFPQR